MTQYDGFISYSHDADDLLAPRLQAGLQRFAKPWWKRRALRIFRDEASLAANPHLWASITEALDDSGWFILLLSPEAAQSEWVNREVEYWLEHQDPDRIIPVLTEGDFSYADGHIVSDAAPPALSGAFTDEPRWVDLRFARTDEQLDLRNASFRAAVADIASAIRGVPKDELESEEVRQHRRTIRTAWAGGIALLLLTVLAGATAIYAIGQSNEATLQRDIAEQNEIEAQNSAALAETEADRAAEEAERANEFAVQMLDIVNQITESDAMEFARAEPGDIPAIPLAVQDSVPDSPRLDFLIEFCDPGTENCFRDASFVHPERPVTISAFFAAEPFHIRHGFVDAGSLAPGMDLFVFVTRVSGPDTGPDFFVIGKTYQFTSDYIIREVNDRCGPGYQSQTEPQPCVQFVHEFRSGLPAGRYNIWAQWRAPCSAWGIAAECPDPNKPISLFASSVRTPFYSDAFTPRDDLEGDVDAGWPFGLWDEAEPLP